MIVVVKKKVNVIVMLDDGTLGEAAPVYEVIRLEEGLKRRK
jgi:hypothetical protein